MGTKFKWSDRAHNAANDIEPNGGSGGAAALRNTPRTELDGTVRSEPVYVGTEKFANCKAFPTVYFELPEQLSVTSTEVGLCEAYLSDLIGAIIANDNEL